MPGKPILPLGIEPSSASVSRRAQKFMRINLTAQDNTMRGTAIKPFYRVQRSDPWSDAPVKNNDFRSLEAATAFMLRHGIAWRRKGLRFAIAPFHGSHICGYIIDFDECSRMLLETIRPSSK